MRDRDFTLVSRRERGFTLVELLVVIAIIAVLATVIVLIVNPTEITKKGRDAARMEDLHNLQSAITTTVAEDKLSGLTAPDILCHGFSNPSSKNPCIGLSTDNGGNSRSTNGTGWVKVDFGGSPAVSLPVLPVDPSNPSLGGTSDYHYIYYSDGTNWEIASKLESAKDQSLMVDNGFYGVGSNLSLIGSEQYLALGNTGPSPSPSPTSLSSSSPNPSSSPSPSPGIYTGDEVDNPNDLSGVAQFENDAGKGASIIFYYQSWGEDYPNFYTTQNTGIRSHGSIPEIVWMSQDGTGSINEPSYTLASIINGSHDAYITQWANAAKAWGHPFFLRFDPEMNGNWEPWTEGVNSNTSGQFVQAWKHVHDIFTSVGANNVTWVWAPNLEGNNSAITLSELYPGDSYVDWTGIDGYNGFGPWTSFSPLFSQTYNDIFAFASSKPMMLAEWASKENPDSSGQTKAQWITEAFNQINSSFPKIKAVDWFNVNKEYDWRIESSAASQQSFKQVMTSPLYTGNTFDSISTSPIPPPGQ